MSNFEVPAKFSFQPYVAEWRMVSAETVDWAEEPKLRLAFAKPTEEPEKPRLRVRIEIPEPGDLGFTGFGLGSRSSYAVVLNRASIPPGLVQPHENHRNTPDMSGRTFRVLICQKPEMKGGLWLLEPGDVTKNAWIMRDEFLSLNVDPDPELGWDWSVRRFLNKWGLWGWGQVYVEGADPTSRLTMLANSLSGPKIGTVPFLMVIPHLLKTQQERYRKALLPKNARPWLRSHTMNLVPADDPPFFRLRASYCAEAIDATITIDHLAERQFGICKRCHKVFQKETQHKKNYCSERCINAANVQMWREKQRKNARKGAKQNVKS